MDGRHVPVESSLLTADGLTEFVLPDYGLPAPVRCRLVSRGVNDTYRVDSGTSTYYLRVAPHGWRTVQELEAEAALIDDLHRRGLRVVQPKRTRNGQATSRVAAPEGERFALLYSAADGEDVREIDVAHSRAYGQLAAAMHDATDAADHRYARFHLDERLLLDEPLASIRADMVDGGKDLAFLEEVAERIRPLIVALPRDPPLYGLCHGDLHPGNVRFDLAGQPTLFDFDFCGYGWRVYDLTIFLWNAFGERRPKGWRDSRWRAFLRGYREIRPLDPAALEALPLFLVAREIWLLGLDCSGRGEWLPQWRTAEWFRSTVGTIRDMVAEYPILGGGAGEGSR